MKRAARDLAPVLAVLVAAGCGSGSHGGAAGSGRDRLTVASSLSGVTVLPHRVRWVARPSIGPSRVAEVDFIIDGRVCWIEHDPPYDYGSSDNGHMASLVTSWLTPGTHRLTVRAIAVDGHAATATVRAQAAPPPAPPPALAGTWARSIDGRDAPAPGSPGNPTETYTPSGRYTMTFEPRWIRDRFPGRFVYPQSNQTGNGFVFLDDYQAGPHLLHVAGEVIFHPESDLRAEGGSWCYAYGPPATYRWTVRGSTLTLAPEGGRDACGVRGFIWTGTWRRVA